MTIYYQSLFLIPDLDKHVIYFFHWNYSLRRGSRECVREQQYRYCESEWSPGEKPKIEFAAFILPLTLSRRFLTPRKVTPEVFQWLVSRASFARARHGGLPGAGIGSGRGRGCTSRQHRRSNSKGRGLSGNTVRPQQILKGLHRDLKRF